MSPSLLDIAFAIVAGYYLTGVLVIAVLYLLAPRPPERRNVIGAIPIWPLILWTVLSITIGFAKEAPP